MNGQIALSHLSKILFSVLLEVSIKNFFVNVPTAIDCRHYRNFFLPSLWQRQFLLKETSKNQFHQNIASFITLFTLAFRKSWVKFDIQLYVLWDDPKIFHFSFSFDFFNVTQVAPYCYNFVAIGVLIILCFFTMNPSYKLRD